MYSRLYLGINGLVFLVLAAGGLLLPLGTDPIWYRLSAVAVALVGVVSSAVLYLGTGNPDSWAGRQLAQAQAQLDRLSAQSLFLRAACLGIFALYFFVWGLGEALSHGLIFPYIQVVIGLFWVLVAMGQGIEGRRAARQDRSQARRSVWGMIVLGTVLVAVVGYGIWWLGVSRHSIPGEEMNMYPLSLAFSPDGKVLASGGFDAPNGSYSTTYGFVRRWDVATGMQIGHPLRGYTEEVYDIAFSPDGRTLTSLEESNGIRLWDLAGERSIRLFGGYSYDMEAIAVSLDGRTIATSSSENGIITLWDAGRGWPRNWPFEQPLNGGEAGIATLAISSDGNILASGSVDGTIRLWNMATGMPVGQPIAAHSQNVSSLAFSPDGKILASGGYDEVIRLWDVATGNNITPAELIESTGYGKTGMITALAFSSDGRLLASGAPVMVWDASTGQPVGDPLGLLGSIYSLVFSPDGRLLAAAGDDHVIHLWDMSQNPPASRTLQ